MTEEPKVIVGVSAEMERTSTRIAKDKAKNARWDLNVAVLLFAVLILVVILATYTEVGL